MTKKEGVVKRKVRYLVDEFNYDNYQAFVKWSNENPVDRTFVEFILDTPGGNATYYRNFMDIVNEYEHEVKIIEASSAGFHFAADSKGKIVINQFSTMMMHIGKLTYTTGEGTKSITGEKSAKYIGKEMRKNTSSIIERLPFTDNEIELIEEDRDAYFTAPDIKRLFKGRVVVR